MICVFCSQPALDAMVLYRHNHTAVMFFYPMTGLLQARPLIWTNLSKKKKSSGLQKKKEKTKKNRKD